MYAIRSYYASLITVVLLTDSKFGSALLPAGAALWVFPFSLLVGGAAAAVAGLMVAFPSFKTPSQHRRITVGKDLTFVQLAHQVAPIV